MHAGWLLLVILITLGWRQLNLKTSFFINCFLFSHFSKQRLLCYLLNVYEFGLIAGRKGGLLNKKLILICEIKMTIPIFQYKHNKNITKFGWNKILRCPFPFISFLICRFSTPFYPVAKYIRKFQGMKEMR